MARTREFDPDHVLEAARRCFEMRGYEATSVDHLVHCTGLSRASLYNAYGDKHGLFDAVLDRYETSQNAKMRECIAKAASPREAIGVVFSSAAAPEAKLGCLIVNSGVELGPADKPVRQRVQRSLGTIHALFRDLLQQMAIEDPDTTASILEASFLGLRVLARTGVDRKQILRIAEETLEKILPAA